MDADEHKAAWEAEVAKRGAARRALQDRLEGEGEDGLAAKLEKCGVPVPMVCTDCGARRVALTRCDLKWCPSCQPALAARTVERFRPCAEAARWPLFVTFTTKGYREVKGIRELRRAWARFRRLRWFRAVVPGGACAFEVTRKAKTWHVHIHALFDCRWFAVREPAPRIGASAEEIRAKGARAVAEVAEQWTLACRRRSSVKVRRVFSRDAGDIAPAIREVFKYSVKGAELADAKKVRGPIGPLIRELSATRLITSFGTFFGKARKRERAPRPCECGAFGCTVPEFVIDALVRKRR